MKKITVISFEESLSHAESLSYNWNNAHDYLAKADVYIGYISRDHYSDAYSAAVEHIPAKKILKSFMDLHEIEEFYITSKNNECP